MVMKKDHPHGRISATTVTLLFLTIPFLVTFFFFLLLSPYKYVTSIPHLIQIFEASFIGFISLVGIRFHHQNPVMKDMKKIIPQLHVKASGRVDKLERFSNYVVRQMGFENIDESYQIGKLAQDYLRNPKVCDNKIFDLFTHNPQRESLYAKLIEEFDKCILSYFAFHWTHATLMITQVLSVDSEPERKLKNIVMAATRKQRFERITKDLKVARVFKTLVEEMKAIGIPAKEESHCTEIMVPAAHSQRSPVLLLMGGGMGAGKSTVLKDILQDAFWSEASSNAVIVEADAFKETDVIYRALSSRGHHHDMLQTAELVHQSSTDAASSLLVTALNEGRDVIMDGTLAWEPFVQQTIAMARKVHQYRYRMGVGYKVSEDGNIIENYWEQVSNEEEDNIGKRKPYRVELVGVVCDAYLAVVRGIRRAITIKRAVRVKSQLTSHKRFAQAFPRYCQLVDNARLYCTNAMGGPPKLIGWKEGDNNLLVDRSQIECLDMVSTLNEDADSIYQVYGHHQDPTRDMGSFWREIVWSPTRKSLQHQLKIAIINNRDGQPNLL